MEETKIEQQPEAPDPQKEHKWLQKLTGEWTFRIEMQTSQEKGPEEFKGTETVRSLGGIWVIAEGEGEVPGGGTANSIMTLGFDPQKGEFVGTFVASMMSHLWVYREGKLDQSGQVLSLVAEGPDMNSPGKTALYRDVIELKNENQRTLSSYVQNGDKWQPMMTAYYERQR